MSPRLSPTLYALALLPLLGACTGADAPADAARFDVPPPRTPADSLVHAAIAAAGQWRLDTATVSFRFRDKTYGLDRRDGRYVYTRNYTDTATGAEITDVLTNDDFARTTDARATSLKPEDRDAYREALNSVVYFAFLPRWLADVGAIREYEALDTLGGRPYHRVRVRFRETGGGTDFQDEFLYWFDVGDYSLDYLAYRYETDGGGVRFRESYNERAEGGIAVRDYRNYAPPEGASVALDDLAGAWTAGELELLSTVALEDVRVGR